MGIWGWELGSGTLMRFGIGDMSRLDLNAKMVMIR